MKHLGKVLILLLVFVSAFLLSTFPLVFHLGEHFAETTDKSFYSYLYWHNYSAIKNLSFLNHSLYFNTNQIFPWPSTLLYSDFMLLGGLVFVPIYTVTKNLIIATNSTAIAFFGLNFLSSFATFKYFTKRYSAAMVGAIVYTFNPLTLAHEGGHAQLMMRFGLPPLFLFTYLYLRKPTLRTAFYAAMFFWLNSFTNIYFFLTGILMVGGLVVIKLIECRAQLFQHVFSWLKYVWITLPFLILIWFYYQPYWAFFQKENASRQLSENISFSAQPIDFITPNQYSVLYRGLYDYLSKFRPEVESRSGLSEHTLWVGLVPLALSIIGAYRLRKSHRQLYEVCLFIVAVAAILSLGPYFVSFANHNSGIRLPYYYLYKYFGAMRSLRVPSRLMFMSYVPLGILTSAGFAYLGKLKSRKNLISAVLLLFLSLELIQNYPIKNQQSIYKQALNLSAQQKLGFLKNQATVHLPTYLSTSNMSSYSTWMILTNEKSFNGYSGYFPPDWIWLGKRWDAHFERQSLVEMNSLGYNYLIIHKDKLARNVNKQIKTVAETNQLKMKLKTPRLVIYNLKSNSSLNRRCSNKLHPQIKVNGLFNGKRAWVEIYNRHDCYLVNSGAKRYFRLEIVSKSTTKRVLSSGYIAVPMLLHPESTMRTSVVLNHRVTDVANEPLFPISYRVVSIAEDKII